MGDYRKLIASREELSAYKQKFGFTEVRNQCGFCLKVFGKLQGLMRHRIHCSAKKQTKKEPKYSKSENHKKVRMSACYKHNFENSETNTTASDSSDERSVSTKGGKLLAYF